jgi:hypothetical protein
MRAASCASRPLDRVVVRAGDGRRETSSLSIVAGRERLVGAVAWVRSSRDDDGRGWRARGDDDDQAAATWHFFEMMGVRVD